MPLSSRLQGQGLESPREIISGDVVLFSSGTDACSVDDLFKRCSQLQRVHKIDRQKQQKMTILLTSTTRPHDIWLFIYSLLHITCHLDLGGETVARLMGRRVEGGPSLHREP